MRVCLLERQLRPSLLHHGLAQQDFKPALAGQSKKELQRSGNCRCCTWITAIGCQAEIAVLLLGEEAPPSSVFSPMGAELGLEVWRTRRRKRRRHRNWARVGQAEVCCCGRFSHGLQQLETRALALQCRRFTVQAQTFRLEFDLDQISFSHSSFPHSKAV